MKNVHVQLNQWIKLLTNMPYFMYVRLFVPVYVKCVQICICLTAHSTTSAHAHLLGFTLGRFLLNIRRIKSNDCCCRYMYALCSSLAVQSDP